MIFSRNNSYILAKYDVRGGIILTLKKICMAENESEENKILIFYRYFSLFVTSFFYLIGNSEHLIQKKLFIIACISVSAVILNFLYIKNEGSYKKINILVLIETLGNSFLLIPSGGMNSPYIWYALNTILITSIKLNKWYCWANLFVYLFSSTVISYLIFGEIELMNPINKEFNLILSFILITAAIQILSKYIKEIKNDREKLVKTNNELQLASKKVKESMNNIMDIYETVHFFTAEKNKKDLIDLMINYIKELTVVKNPFFIDLSSEKNEIFINDENSEFNLLKENLKNKILKDLNSFLYNEDPIEVKMENKRFMIIVVKSSYRTYGILGFEIEEDNGTAIYKESMERIRFFKELGAIAFERAYLEEVNEQLLINEEQNRIANEIHDSVLQKLFSVSCGIFGLMKNIEKLDESKVKEELNTIRDSIDSAMKELRHTIYGLSWEKDGINSFEEDIFEYINQTKKLNNADITFDVTGNMEFLSLIQKKAIYRIICEGIGNAVHHGKADHISVSLNIEPKNNLLRIADNGKGFNTNGIKNNKGSGLGIKNLYYLTESLNGEINITSKTGIGTEINITIPNNIMVIERKNAV
mgnify:CR=1 FL=1